MQQQALKQQHQQQQQQQQNTKTALQIQASCHLLTSQTSESSECTLEVRID